MSEEPEFFTYTREEFLDEFVHPDDRPAVEEARQRRALQPHGPASCEPPGPGPRGARGAG